VLKHVVCSLLLATLACRAGALEPRSLGLVSFHRSLDGLSISDSTGTPFPFPLLGGFDRPRPQLIDIDGDGDLDLFIQEYGREIMFFENVTGRFVWRTDRFHDLDVGEWNRFADADGDGDFDVFAEQPFSQIRYIRNVGTRTAPRFVAAVDTLRDAAGTAIYAERQNIAQIADLDCNGRLDLLLGRVDGTITRYESIGLDPAGAPRFRFVTDRFQDIQIIGPPGLHGANTMAVVDVDGDGDQDILWGDFFEAGILWLRNDRTCDAPEIHEHVPFPTNEPLRTSGYNAPTAADLDGDGDLDLLVGVLGGAFNPVLSNRDNLYFLEQTRPGVYQVRTTRFLSSLDLGSETVPALADLDGDGDLDLVVGTKIETSDQGRGTLYLLENTGSPRGAAFRLKSEIALNAGYHLAPAFGDLDADGDLDLVLGVYRDALLYYENTGTRTSSRFTLADTALVRLTRGSTASPALADLDADGDLDLLVGEAQGTVNFYRNDGTPGAPRFVLVSDEYEGIDVGRRSAPRPVDLDGDGDLDLLIGSEAGPAGVFRNVGSRQAPRFQADSTLSVHLPPFSAPAVADLDGDGVLDVLSGGAGGGLVLSRGVPRR
jgi:VCBS repeat protein